MADGYESDRTEAYFSGRLKLPPRPRRIAPMNAGQQSDADPTTAPGAAKVSPKP